MKTLKGCKERAMLAKGRRRCHRVCFTHVLGDGLVLRPQSDLSRFQSDLDPAFIRPLSGLNPTLIRP